MRWPRVNGGIRRLPVTALAVFVVWSFVLWLFLPYDNPILLIMRFASFRILSLMRNPSASDDWLFEPPEFPVRFDRDVAFIIKTGYGTQARVPAQLDALNLTSSDGSLEDVLVIADFSTKITHKGQNIDIHDVVAAMAQHEKMAPFRGFGKLGTWKNMTTAIAAGKTGEAHRISSSAGWELDAMKFISGLELAYKTMPDKKWYIMLDDDSYLLKPSLSLILGHVDHTKPRYLGNAVGDYKGRFAHGGSSVILSWAAMSRLFDHHTHLVPVAYVDSLTETWGDKLVATTFMKAGIYLDERYSHHFSGEPPRMTRLHPDRFCSPIVSFHGLADPEQMRETGNVFRNMDGPVLWSQLWKIYHQPDFASFTDDPIRLGRDYVGRPDEATRTIEDVESVEKCLQICELHDSTCLAWTYDKNGKSCNIGPWLIAGDKPPEKSSGINVARVKRLVEQCHR